MKITHYCNSFISVNEGGSKIVCDPWLGKADNNAWLSYPLHSNGARTLNRIKGNYRKLGEARLGLSRRAGNVSSLINQVPTELKN